MQTQPREVQSSEDDQLPGERTQSRERGCGDDCNRGSVPDGRGIP